MGIVLVGLGTPEKAKEFRDRLDLPFVILSDPDKHAYEEYGLTFRLNFARELARPVETATNFFRDVSRHGVGATDQDIGQLGGIFVIDTSGTVRYAFRQLRASDHPPSADLIAAITPSDPAPPAPDDPVDLG